MISTVAPLGAAAAAERSGSLLVNDPIVNESDKTALAGLEPTQLFSVPAASATEGLMLPPPLPARRNVGSILAGSEEDEFGDGNELRLPDPENLPSVDDDDQLFYGLVHLK